MAYAFGSAALPFASPACGEGSDANGPIRKTGWSRQRPWDVFFWNQSGGDAGGFFHDGEAHAGLVASLFGDRAPGVLGLLAGLERTLHLGRAFHELVEVHRTELAANHPEIAACRHDRLLL